MMNTSVKTFVVTALVAVSTFAVGAEKSVFISEKSTVNLSTADFALAHYIAVTTEGASAAVEQLFADDFIQKIQASSQQTYGRSAVIKCLKKQKGEILNCKVITKIVEKSADYMIAKIILKFERFSITDLVTLVYEDGSWKVSTSVYSY